MNTKKVKFTVEKQLPYGLLVSFEGRRGLIRLREISWDPEERRKWQSQYPLGSQALACIVKEEDSELTELSIRLAKRDPWSSIGSTYRAGMILPGVVTGVVSYGAFIQLDEAITGLLHISGLPSWAPQNPVDLFWPGDRVMVRIIEVDNKRKRVSLSLVQPVPPGDNSRIPVNTVTPTKSSVTPISKVELFLHSGRPRRHILVVEDDPAQAKTVSIWLQRIGQRVSSASNGTHALEIVAKETPDLALVDLRLPDMLGIKVIQQILEKAPGVNCVLMTDWSHADEYSLDLQGLADVGVGQLLKPLLPDDLLDLLLKPPSNQAVAYLQPFLQPIQANLSETPHNRQGLDLSIQELLEQCKLQTNFDACFLFVLDPTQRSVEVVQHVGGSSYHKGSLPGLLFSPVQDAAEDGEFVWVERLTDHHLPRFRYLQEFYPFCACMGYPVPVNIPQKYSLFLFHSEPVSITPALQVFAQGIAYAIGAALVRYAFLEQSIALQRTALLGHLTRGLVHEINHQLNVLNASMFSLEANFKSISKNKNDPLEIDKRIERSNRHLAALQNSVQSITHTTRQFGHILTRPKEELLRIDELVNGAVGLVRDFSDRAGVKLFWQSPDNLLVVRGQGTAIEQVLVNVLLNAIQQISLYSTERGGWIQIRTETQPEAADQKIVKILVQDSGPGIHLRLWETIFEPGFTTREDGGGMGLYISRSLMESMQGKIKVRESYILGGTTFSIELPWQI